MILHKAPIIRWPEASLPTAIERRAFLRKRDNLQRHGTAAQRMMNCWRRVSRVKTL